MQGQGYKANRYIKNILSFHTQNQTRTKQKHTANTI